MRQTVVIADDHAGYRLGLRTLLESDGRFEVVGESADGLDAFSLIEELRPRFALLDLGMEGLSGLEVIRALRRAKNEVRIVVVTNFADEAACLDAEDEGANAFVLKTRDLADVLAALDAVSDSDRFAQFGFSGAALAHRREVRAVLRKDALRVYNLSPRESEVLHLFAQGFISSKEIGAALQIDPHTADGVVSSLLRKIGCSSRGELLRFALRTKPS